MKNILLALVLVLLATDVQAQQRTFYDSSGKIVGRASADSQGSSTIYDSSGKLVGRESKSGNTTTVYDATGRSVGKVTNGTR